MLSDLGLDAVDLSAAALVALTVLLLLRGNLVPRSVLNDVRADRDTRISECRTETQTWREAYLASEEARRVLADQVDELLEHAKTTDHFIRSLPEAIQRSAHPAPPPQDTAR